MSAQDDAQQTPEELGYAGALAELDSILVELEDETLNVDILADQVGRASELISFCRTRIRDAQLNVEQIVADIDAGDEDTPTDS